MVEGNRSESTCGDVAVSAAATSAMVTQSGPTKIAEQDGKAWPTCPTHSFGLHPLQVGGAALWTCKGSGGHTVTAVGELEDGA